MVERDKLNEASYSGDELGLQNFTATRHKSHSSTVNIRNGNSAWESLYHASAQTVTEAAGEAPLLVGGSGGGLVLGGALLSGGCSRLRLLARLHGLLRLLRVAFPSLSLHVQLPLELVHLGLRPRRIHLQGLSWLNESWVQ